MENKERNQWAMFCHLSAICGIIIPFGNVVAPVILWQMKRSVDPYVDEQGKEVVNFQIFLAIIGIGIYLLSSVFYKFQEMFSSALSGMGAISVTGLMGIVIFGFSIYGALQAKEGKSFKYPTPFRFVS